MTHGAANRKMTPRSEDDQAVAEAAGAIGEVAPENRFGTEAEDRRLSSPGPEHGMEQADEGVPPQAEGDTDAEDGPGHLERRGSPRRASRRGRAATTATNRGSPVGRRTARGPAICSPSRERARLAVQAADPPGAADGEREDGQAEEGDGQHDPRHHGDADEGQADARRGRPRRRRSRARTTGRCVNGSRRMRRARPLAAVICASLTASDISRPPRRTRTSLSSACSTIMRPVARPARRRQAGWRAGSCSVHPTKVAMAPALWRMIALCPTPNKAS